MNPAIQRPTATWHTLLDQCEQQLAQVAQATASPQIDDLGSAATALQTLVVQLPALLRQSQTRQTDPLTRQRLRKIAALLATQRESLLRRTVLVERALSTLMPATQSNTYALGVGRATYGAPGRQSGEFKMTAA